MKERGNEGYRWWIRKQAENAMEMSDKLHFVAGFHYSFTAESRDILKPKSADKKLAKSISLNIHRGFGAFSGFRPFTQRVKGQNDEKARGYWVKPHFPNPYRRIGAEVCRTFLDSVAVL